jgi:malate permease and related proteins
MLTVFAALAVIAVAGSSLRYLVPTLDADAARRQCGALVLYVLLPALNIDVLYRASLGSHLWQIPVAMLVGIGTCAGAALLLFSHLPLDRRAKSSLILAAAFGNVTYLGMPLLRGLFAGETLEATEIAILCEVAVTCTDLILGTLLALYYLPEAPEPPRGVPAGRAGAAATGDHRAAGHPSLATALGQLARFPLLWSVAIAAILRALAIPLPDFLLTALHLMGETAPGLMLLVLGMAIKPTALARSLALTGGWGPALVLKLGLSPLVVLAAGSAIGLSGLHLQATTLEAAMPPQLFIFVIADRFGFDTELLATVVALLTIVSFFTLPLLNTFLGAWMG